MSLSRLNHSPDVNLYLALYFRHLAMQQDPDRASQEDLRNLEDAMDEVWGRLLDVETDEVNEIIGHAYAAIRGSTTPRPFATRDPQAFLTRHAPVPTVGRAFLNVLLMKEGRWQATKGSTFVSRVLDSLARLPTLAPSPEEYGKAFVKLLQDPGCHWQKTPDWPFLLLVAQEAMALQAPACVSRPDVPVASSSALS